MRWASVCSGIGGPEVAWSGLSEWECVFMSEIDPFARAVLSHHYPNVPLLGDFTEIRSEDVGPVDLLVAGTPCQDFSIAGLRAGLGGESGKLTIEFVRLCERLRPRWAVWENVPGVLSADKGLAFGVFLGALADAGYHAAWAVLDAQWFGVAQRRRRVFLVGYLGDWRRAAAVLLEPQSLRGHTAPSRQTGQAASTLFASGAGTERPSGTASETGFLVTAFAQNQRNEVRELGAAGALAAIRRGDGKNETLVSTYDNIHPTPPANQMSDRGVAILAFTTQQEPKWSENGIALTITADSPTGGGQRQSIAFTQNQTGAPTLTAQVRRLTPLECERLQGFPDGYTDIEYRHKPAADGPRYRALGNAMPVPVVRYIGERIALIEEVAT